MTENDFFGRDEYLTILEKRIRGLKDGYRQNIAIIGDEMVGKTTLIYEFLDKFCDNNFILLYLEARPESLPNFCSRFIGVLLYSFLSNSCAPLKEDLNFLIARASKYAPKTAEKCAFILSAVGKRKKIHVLTDLLSLCDTMHQETGKYCVVMLDEFHNMEQFGIKELYKEWARLLIVQKTTMYILISSMKYKARNILAKDLSLLFGNFEVLNIGPFDTHASAGFLERQLSSCGIKTGLKSFIVHFTGGYPFYLKVIADALSVSKGTDLADILENLLFDASGILNQRFSNYLKRFLDSPNSNDYMAMLYSISQGHNKIKEVAAVLHKPQTIIVSRMNRLLELDAITKSGDFLKINDRVFSYWLKFVYQQKQRSLTFDSKNQKALFRGDIASMIDEFLVAAQMPMNARLAELLHLFSDDTVQLERKRLRLDHFREIKTLQFSKGGLTEGLLGRSNDSLWILGVKREALTEEDITEFAKECKKYRHKLQQKIIIALNDIDSNARLRAMEEKILTLDVSNLNQLLDLYSKPRVIL